MGRLLRRKRVTEPALDDSSLGQAPERFNFARDVVEAFAADPHRQALTFVDSIGVVERRTFKEIAGEASRWAGLLRSRGLAPGDRVLVLLAGTPAWPAVLLGALKAGLVPVPCPASVPALDVQLRVEQTGARLVVTDRAHAPMLSESGAPAGLVVAEDAATELRGLPVDAPTHDTASSEIALILYPSGPTRAVKGATHAHGATWAARLLAEYWLDARPDDLVWCTAETGSAKAIWNGLLAPWSQGAEIVIHEGGFEPEQRIELVRRLGVTVLCQTPAEYRLLAEHPSIGYGALDLLRHAVSAGGPLDPHALEVFRDALGVTVHEGYWQTESTILVANMSGRQLKPGSMGLPMTGLHVAVISEEGREQAPGTEGDIAVRGRPASLFLEYWNAPDETEAVFRGPWYVTGDRATRDVEGHFWFAGRADEIIPDAAHRIGPFAAESALLEHPAVAQSAVIGKPGAAGGEIVKAFVVLRPGAQPSDELVLALHDKVKVATAPSEVAREIEFVPELPMTASGKVRKDELRKRERPPGGVRPVEVAASVIAASPGPAEQPREAEQQAGKRPEEAAAEEARRDEAETRRAGAAKAKEDERQRKRDEKRRNEEAKAAAEPGRSAGEAQEPDESANPLLVSRLRAYGRHQDSGRLDPPPQ